VITACSFCPAPCISTASRDRDQSRPTRAVRESTNPAHPHRPGEHTRSGHKAEHQGQRLGNRAQGTGSKERERQGDQKARWVLASRSVAERGTFYRFNRVRCKRHTPLWERSDCVTGKTRQVHRTALDAMAVRRSARVGIGTRYNDR
jgi:hypothetical protein